MREWERVVISGCLIETQEVVSYNPLFEEGYLGLPRTTMDIRRLLRFIPMPSRSKLKTVPYSEKEKQWHL